MNIMKTHTAYSIITFLIVISFLSCNQPKQEEKSISAARQESTTPAVQNDLPNMAITTLQGKNFSIKNQSGKIVLVLFQPDCDDCQREAVQIRDNMEAFNGYSLYFISSAPMPEIEGFSKDYKLSSFENVVFGQTTVPNVINTLGPIPAPSVYIYSNEGKLVKQFNGEVDIKEIKSAL